MFQRLAVPMTLLGVVMGSNILGVRGAVAATITNIGASSVVLVIVEDGAKVEVSVDAGASETICSAGCFVTLPNGDRIALSGGETLEVHDGGALVK